MNIKETKIYPYFDGKRFQNNAHHKAESFWFGTIPSFIRSLKNRNKRIPKKALKGWHTPQAPGTSSFEPKVTWIGHASFLIQLGNINIVTDPIFGDSSWMFKRILPPGVLPQDMPQIDLAIISHNHYDHMDKNALTLLKKANPAMQILVPQGDKQWCERNGFTHSFELMWWDQHKYTKKASTQIDQTIMATFLPAWHWSQRGIFDKNKSLWGSWMLEWQGYHIYFGGDTAYSQHFKNIAHHFPSIDLALMPIGPCEPRWWMKKTHMDSYEAAQAFLDLNAKQFIPMHWGAFPFGIDQFLLPIERLQKAWQEKNIEKDQLHIMTAGQDKLFGQTKSIAPQEKQSIIQVG